MELLDKFCGFVPGLVGVVILVEDGNRLYNVEVYLIGCEMKRIWFTMNKAKFDKFGLEYLIEVFMWIDSELKAESRVDSGTMVHNEVMQMWEDKNVVNYRYKDQLKSYFIW